MLLKKFASVLLLSAAAAVAHGALTENSEAAFVVPEVQKQQQEVSATDGVEPHPVEQVSSKDTVAMRMLLKTNGIIPDVLNDFQPTVEVALRDAKGVIPPGTQTYIADEVLEPEVTLSLALQPTKQYTLLMTDPGVLKTAKNVRAPANENAWQWLHWVVLNIPGSELLSNAPLNGKGDVLVPYSGPNPPQGNHRYAFLVFEQDAPNLKVTTPAERGGWNTRAFMTEHKLKPVAGNFYFCAPDGAPSA